MTPGHDAPQYNHNLPAQNDLLLAPSTWQLRMWFMTVWMIQFILKKATP